jgi:hypothetical protein
MKKILKVFGYNLLDSAKDLAPIVLVIGFFQLNFFKKSFIIPKGNQKP